MTPNEALRALVEAAVAFRSQALYLHASREPLHRAVDAWLAVSQPLTVEAAVKATGRLPEDAPAHGRDARMYEAGWDERGQAILAALPAPPAAPTSESRKHSDASEQDRLAAIGEAVERLPDGGPWHIDCRPDAEPGYRFAVFVRDFYDPDGCADTLPAAVDAALADRGQEERTDG